MPVIQLETLIKAPVERLFDLSRSIELHLLSTEQTGEQAVAGKTTGLIGLGEWVTWRARHFGIWQKLTSQITAYQYPTYFCDEMVRGAFAYFRHEHHFGQTGTVTVMKDVFAFGSPLGPLGRLFNQLVLTDYLKKLLEERNRIIKQVAESEQWKEILPTVVTKT